MKIRLIAGTEHKYIAEALLKDHRVVISNSQEMLLTEAMESLKDMATPFDKIVVTDGGLSADCDSNERELEHLSSICECGVVVVTRDFLLNGAINGVEVVYTPWFRAVKGDFDSVFKTDKKSEKSSGGFKLFNFERLPTKQKDSEPPKEKDAKIRKWGLTRRTEREEVDNTDGVSMASSKVVVFTGHRGSGATCTAVNTAISACRRGINTMLIDLDVEYRSVNLYFGEFYKQADENDEVASSLIRILAQPQSYQTMAVNVENNLWVTTLGYGFGNERLIEQHFTESKIIGLITSLRHSFDFVAVDFPLDGLSRCPNLLNNVDAIALCMENTIYSAVTTLRNIAVRFAERERIRYLASKAKLVATKYNDESMFNDEIITPARLSELIVSEGFCEDFKEVMPVAGGVPYINWFGRQIESDIPVMDMDSQMQKAYDEILLRLLGGAR